MTENKKKVPMGAEDNVAADLIAPVAPDHSAMHSHGEFHHHHHHACSNHHEGGHHLLQVEHLSVSFTLYDEEKGYWSGEKTQLDVIDDLSISVHTGEIVAIVGASGSGKTLLADAIMGLYAPNSQVKGTIYYDGVQQDVQGLAQLRGREIAFVPQSVASLDPLMRIGKQIGGSAVERHALYERYGLDTSVDKLYPFELSGGMARRVLLLTALMNKPKLIIADEPTPGLDLELAVKAMDDFRAFANAGGSVLLITHDIQLALRVADRIAVFKDGTVIEETSVASFADPALLEHPFTRALWHALPEHDFAVLDYVEEDSLPSAAEGHSFGVAEKHLSGATATKEGE